MKTKIVNKFILLLISVFTLIGCDEFLEEEVRSQVSPSNFFNTDEEAQLAVNGLYRILQNGSMYNLRGLDDFTMFGADELEASRNAGATSAITNYLIAEGVKDGNGTWSQLYELVNASTEFITRIEGNEKLSEEIRNQAIGELLFMRALAYFHLTNLWGDVPYIREVLDPVEAGKLGRFDKVQIRADMKSDLERAISLLASSHPELASRVTKWAAAALKAKYHLYDKEWQLAKDECDFIINNSHHSLLNNFADVFDRSDPENSINNEHIFVIDFKADDRPSRQVDAFNPRIRDEPKNRNNRPGGAGTPRNWELLQTAMADLNEDMQGFGLSVPLLDFAKRVNWQDGDLRYDATIVTEYLGFPLKHPYFRKLWNLDQINSLRENHHDNYVVYRLADIYLMAAEAENELNGPGTAYSYVNIVRERAFEPDQPWSGLSQTEFKESMYDERKFELAAEGQRKMDLIRWGILLEVVQSQNYRSFNNGATNIRPYHVLLPIPQDQLILNPNLLDSDPTNNGYR